MMKVVLLGDSIRMGYQAAAVAALQGQTEVWAPEENGRTSHNLLEHLDAWVLARRPDVLHVNAGLHDLIRLQRFGMGHQVPLEAYRSNVRTLLELVGQALPQTTLIWATTTPVILDRQYGWGKHQPPEGRREEDVQAYNAAARVAAGELGAVVNDLHAFVVAQGAERLLGPDGVHFTAEGSALLGQRVAGVIKEACGPAR